MAKIKSSSTCCSCLKIIDKSVPKSKPSDTLKEIFKKFIEIELPDGEMCSPCKINLLTFNAMQQEIKKQHEKRIKTNSPTALKSTEKITEGKLKDPERKEGKLKDPEKHDISKTLVIGKLVGKKIIISKTAIKPKVKEIVSKIPEETAEKHLEASTKPEPVSVPKKQKCKKIVVPMRKSQIVTKIEIEDEDVIELPPEPPIDIDSLPEEKVEKKIEKSKLFKCNYCTAVSPKPEVIANHIQLHHTFHCSRQCGKFFPTDQEMKKHLQEMHKAVVPIAPALPSTTTRKRKQALEPINASDEMNFRLQGVRVSRRNLDDIEFESQ